VRVGEPSSFFSAGQRVSLHLQGMSVLRLGINGLGRIGRAVLRASLAREDVEVVAINDLTDPDDLAYLMRYDSVHGRLPVLVEATSQGLMIDGREISVTAERDPAKVQWAQRGAETIIESTGFFTQREKAALHLQGGAKRVLISGPSKDADGIFVPWVNTQGFDAAKHQVVSMASCTTNCIAPICEILHRHFGIENLLLTTVHAYTSTQAIHDKPASKKTRGRAAAVNIVPTSTGAAKATALVIPELAGRLDGMALRVPIPDGSVADMVFRLEKDTDVEAIHRVLREEAAARYEGVMTVSEDPLVSADIIGDPHSSIVDGPSTMAMGARTFKILSWYDNEIGYSTRLLDFANFMRDES
jgi:glyceraldehyde 3-phosphate dehydrogenase